jgi:hypothetical protein
MMLIKGDREPGHLPSEEFLAQMGKYNKALSRAGLLLDLAALRWSAEGVRVKFSSGERTVIDGPFGEAKGDRRRLLDSSGGVDGGGHGMGQAAPVCGRW